jgi:hypothetical protein
VTTYTIWQDDSGITVTLGSGPPCFADGSAQNPQNKLVCTIEANSYVEAMQKLYDLRGWGTYKP